LHECAGKEEKKGLLEEDARMTPTAYAGELAGQAYVRNTVLGK